jgi:hypothetical protein
MVGNGCGPKHVFCTQARDQQFKQPRVVGRGAAWFGKSESDAASAS